MIRSESVLTWYMELSCDILYKWYSLGFKGQRSRLGLEFGLTLCSITQKMNDPKVFKLGIAYGITLGYRASDIVLG